MSNFLERLLEASPAGKREAIRAALRVQVTEELLARMEQMKLSKADLANSIGITRSAVTQALNGHRNLSLNTLADLAEALGVHARFSLTPKTQAVAMTPRSAQHFAMATSSTAINKNLSPGQTQATGYSAANRKVPFLHEINIAVGAV